MANQGYYLVYWNWDIKKHTPPTTPEDWEAYNQLKERIRAIYPPGEDERLIGQLQIMLQM